MKKNTPQSLISSKKPITKVRSKKDTCEYCGDLIEPRTSLSGGEYATCGSYICESKHKMRKKKKLNPKIIKVMFCAFCGKKFNRTSLSPTKIYCTRNCTRNAHNLKYKEFSFRTRFEILKRDNFTCQYCGRNVKDDKIKLQVDHIIPKSKGGKTSISNLTTSCFECNLGKSDVLLEERRLRREQTKK